MSIDTILTDIEDLGETVGDDVLYAIEGVASKFDADVWPYVKKFLLTLASQTGQVALKAAIAAAPLLATGGFAAAGAAVGTAVVASPAVNSVVDAQTVLSQAQAALQVVKVANVVQTPGDATTVTAIQAAVPAGAASAPTS